MFSSTWVPTARDWVNAIYDWIKELPKEPEPDDDDPLPPKKSARRWLAPVLRAGETVISAGLFIAAVLMVGRWALTEFKRPPEAPRMKVAEPLPTTDTGPPLFKEIFK